MGTIKGIRIELAMTDDLKQSASAMNASVELVQNSIKDADKAIVKVRTDANLAGKTQSKEASILVKAENLAKELGVDVNSVGGYKEADLAYQKLEKAIASTKDY